MATSDSKPPRLEITVPKIPGPDFTAYDKKLEDRLGPSYRTDAGKRDKKYSYSGSVVVRVDGETPMDNATATPRNKSKKSPDKPLVYGRALACRAYGGRYWSVTVRCKGKRTSESGEREWARRLAKYAGGRDKCEKFLGYCPAGHPGIEWPADNEGGEIFLNDIYTLSCELERILFGEADQHPHGLIAVTGATDSSKSLITRGLIFLHLQRAADDARAKGLRRPHLLTFEDPVEQYYVKDPQARTAPELPELRRLLEALYVDYTPREKGEDAGNLRRVTKDALRQTPSVLFVGETREQEDWEDLLEFAGSNHLVITTSHASSVVEAMSGIFRAAGVKTPARRSEVARRILGIINIRSFTPPSPHNNIRALLPAVWKRTSQSINNLIADGLASILPVSGPFGSDGGHGEPRRRINYYGRAYFARLLSDPSRMTPRMNARGEKDNKGAVTEIKKQATEWDLKGV